MQVHLRYAMDNVNLDGTPQLHGGQEDEVRNMIWF